VTLGAGYLVGREEELRALVDLLEAPETFPRVAVLFGEAGIGKTTLWLAGVEAGDRLGYRVLASRPSEAEVRYSFAGLSDLLGETVAEILSELPAPQRRALESALALSDAEGVSAEWRGSDRPQNIEGAKTWTQRASRSTTVSEEGRARVHRLLDAVGLTVEATLGHYRVLRDRSLSANRTGGRSRCRSHPTRCVGAKRRSSSYGSSGSSCSKGRNEPDREARPAPGRPRRTGTLAGGVPQPASLIM
jgi:hypothetical protein